MEGKETSRLVPAFFLSNLITYNVVTYVKAEIQSMEPTIYETNLLLVDRFLQQVLLKDQKRRREQSLRRKK